MCSVVPNYFCCKAIVLELQRRLEEMTLMTVVQNIGEIRKTPWESDGEFAPSAESEPDVATCMPLPASIVSETRAASTVNQAQSFQSTSQRSPLDSLAYGRNVRFDAATSEATSSGEFTNSAITNSVIANNDSVANSSSASQSNTSRSQLLRVKKELQQSISYVDSNHHATETVLRETLIEVVRYRSNEPKKPIAEPQPSRSSAPLPHEAKTMIVESKSSNLVLSSSSNATSESDNRSVLSAEPHNVPGRPQPPVGTKGSGSLRHLLRHITHSRDGRVESESGK